MDILKEFDYFLTDLESNITNAAELEYVKQKVEALKQKIVPTQNLEISKCESIERRLGVVEGILKNMQQDIYKEEAFELEIICPFCNSDFTADINDGNDEIECPNCSKIIELDWSGEEGGCCGGGCCGGGCHEHLSDEDM